MLAVFYVLGVWLIASVPVALLLGWACGLNDLSRDRDELLLVDGPAPSQAAIVTDRRPRELDAAA